MSYSINSRNLHISPARRAWLLAIAGLSMFVLAACSSGGGNDDAPDEFTGSGQVPVENPDGTGRPGSPLLTGDARQGLDIYTDSGCSTCHTDPELGPTHENIYEIAASRVPGLSADEYIEQSVRQPDAFIVEGWGPETTMPAYDGLDAQAISQLIAYMKTLVPDDGVRSEVNAASLPPGNAENGQLLYGSIGCSGCHSQGADRIVGPGFKGVIARAAVRQPGFTAEEYIVESIVDPGAFIVEGFPSQMPAYDELTPQEVADIIEFLRALN